MMKVIQQSDQQEPYPVFAAGGFAMTTLIIDKKE